jgi:hypothetical protein
MTLRVDAFLVPNNMAVDLFLQKMDREKHEKLARKVCKHTISETTGLCIGCWCFLSASLSHVSVYNKLTVTNMIFNVIWSNWEVNLANRLNVHSLRVCHVNYKLSRHKLRSELILLCINYFPGIYFSSLFFCCHQFVLLVWGRTRNNVSSAAPLKLIFFCLPVLVRLIYSWNHLERLPWYWTHVWCEALVLVSLEFGELAISLYQRSVVLGLLQGSRHMMLYSEENSFLFYARKLHFL